MHRILWNGATGTLSQMQYLDNTANNIANTSTNSFKCRDSSFAELVSQNLASTGDNSNRTFCGTGVKVTGSYSDFTPGLLTKSDNPLNLAINGKGFFRVVDDEGREFYTRDGNFQVDEKGRLANILGQFLPDIEIPEDTREVLIHSNGSVEVIDTEGNTDDAGRVTLFTFESSQGLQPVGNNLFEAGTESGDPQEQYPGENETGELKQGFMELSNVDMTKEMTALVTTQRALQMNAQSIKTADQLWEMANNLRR
jgi:flagellar basal-body rod protein FlgG